MGGPGGDVEKDWKDVEEDWPHRLGQQAPAHHTLPAHTSTMP
jgi:hypothetical protein